MHTRGLSRATKQRYDHGYAGARVPGTYTHALKELVSRCQGSAVCLARSVQAAVSKPRSVPAAQHRVGFDLFSTHQDAAYNTTWGSSESPVPGALLQAQSSGCGFPQPVRGFSLLNLSCLARFVYGPSFLAAAFPICNTALRKWAEKKTAFDVSFPLRREMGSVRSEEWCIMAASF